MTKFLIYTLISLTGIPLLTFGQRAERIVSLAPSLTKNIYYLGAQDQLVGCTNYCKEALADRKEVVANAVKVNIEKLAGLKPDLVLTTPLTDPETLELIRKFSIRTENFSSPESFEEICEQFARLGNLTGKQNTADKIIRNARQKVSEMKTNTTFPRKKIFFQIGAEPLFTVLPKTFMNDYILLSGGKNIIEQTNRGTVTRESVIAQNPEVIFIVTMGITGNEEQKIWQQYKGLSAADQHRIYIIDAEKACSPTPVTFVETLDTIQKLMYRKHE